jgi:hypothetical protein
LCLIDLRWRIWLFGCGGTHGGWAVDTCVGRGGDQRRWSSLSRSRHVVCRRVGRHHRRRENADHRCAWCESVCAPTTSDTAPELNAFAAALAQAAERYGVALGVPRHDDGEWAAKLEVVRDFRPELVSFTFGSSSEAQCSRRRCRHFDRCHGHHGSGSSDRAELWGGCRAAPTVIPRTIWRSDSVRTSAWANSWRG